MVKDKLEVYTTFSEIARNFNMDRMDQDQKDCLRKLVLEGGESFFTYCSNYEEMVHCSFVLQVLGLKNSLKHLDRGIILLHKSLKKFLEFSQQSDSTSLPSESLPRPGVSGVSSIPVAQ